MMQNEIQIDTKRKHKKCERKIKLLCAPQRTLRFPYDFDGKILSARLST